VKGRGRGNALCEIATGWAIYEQGHNFSCVASSNLQRV
jgi:hypothetical protein